MANLLSNTTIGGYQSIHTGNISSYAVTTGGSTMTGALAINSVAQAFTNITLKNTSSASSMPTHLYFYIEARYNSGSNGTNVYHWVRDSWEYNITNNYSDITLGATGSGSSYVKLFTVSTDSHVYATNSFRAPVFYDSADTSYYTDPNDVSQLHITKTALRAHKNMTGYGVGNWISDFSNTPVSSMTFGQDKYDGGPAGTWWFQVNMRHNNGSNLWGTQLAYGWEDNSNEIYQRNVTGGNWSGWVRYINSSNYAGILDARYYTESEVNSLLSAKQDSSTAITTSNIGSQTVASAGNVQGYSAYDLVVEARGMHSGSDFVNGTLVRTDINANGWAGNSFIMEVSGKSYGSGTPFKLAMEGYLYADTIINVSAMSYGSYFPGPVKVMRLDGILAFWWPRGSYWNSFQVHVRVAEGNSWNTVTSIADSVDPPSADKKISITPVQVIHTNNIGSQSVSYATTAGSISGFNNPTTASTANTIVYRDASGDVAAREFVLTSSTVHTVTPSSIVGIYPTTNQVVKFSASAIQTFLGLGSLAYSSATIPTNNNQLTNGAGYITGYTETDTLNSVTGRGNTTSNSVRFGTHVDLSPTGSAFRFYDGSTFRGGFGLDSWGHAGSDANLVLYVNGDNTLFFSTAGTKRASLSSTAFNSLVALQQSGNQVLHAGNYTSYSPSLTGSGASGTWGINVTGTAARATRANGNFYIDDNYGNSIVGLYNSTILQGVFAMGDSYKLTAGGGAGNLYGLAWSHPNAGGVASNLNTHGLLVMENGGFLAAISGSIRARDDMRAPIFYDSQDTGYYVDPNSTSNINNLSVIGYQSIGGQTSNGQSNYQWSGATYQTPGDWTARLILRRDNASTGVNGSIPSLVIFNNNGADQTTASMVFATNECVTGSNSVNLAGIVAKKESVGNCGGWSAGSLNFFVKNYGSRVDSLALTPDGNATFSGIVYSTGYGNSSQWNTAYGWGNHASAGYLTGAHNHDDRYYTESESDSRYLILGGSWGADLTSNGWTRKVGYAADGGEWVLLSASGQISSLLDGSYFAGEQGGFYSMGNSNTYASRRGFYNDGTYANFNTPLKAASYVLNTGAFMEGYGSYSSKLGRVAMISFDWNSTYDEPYNHGIMSTSSDGSFSDNISINSFNDITLRLDANNNNTESYLRVMNNTPGTNTIAHIGYNGANGVASFSRDLYVNGGTGGNFGNRIVVGADSTPYTIQDGNIRPTVYLTGAYPVLALNHTVTGNISHGPTVQFTFNGSNQRQWVIGCGGAGDFMDFGFSSNAYGNTNWNPHNGIDGYAGNTIMRIIDNAVGIGGDWGANGSAGNPGYTLDVRGTIYSNTDMRAPIFYDSQDTGYYLDPNSTSVLNGVGTHKIWNHNLGSTYYFAGGDWGLRHNTPSGWIQFGPANSGHAHIYTDRPNFYFNADLLVNGATVITSSSIGSQSVSYASSAGSVAWTNVSSRPTNLSQFTNDLGNYGGWITSSGSISGNAATATTASNLAADTSTRFKVITFTGEGYDSGNGNAGSNYGIYQQGGSWTHPYPDLCIGFHTGIKIGAQSQYNGIRFYNTETWGTEIFSVGNGDNHVRVLNNLYVTGTVTGSNLSGTNTGDQTNISGNAATATNVAWTGVTGRPTALSQFSNDLGNYGGWLTTGGKAADSELIDGIDSSRIVFGDGARASTYVSSMDDPNQKSGYFFKDNPTGQPFGDWWNWMTVAGNSWQSSNNYSFQIAHAFHSDDAYIRRMTNGSTFSWRTLITSGNIGSQSVNYANSAGSATNAGQLNTYGYLVGDNWDTYYTSGKLRVASASGATGVGRPPSSVHNYGSLLSYGISGEDMFQMYFPDNAGNSIANGRKLHYRTGRGTWCDWRTVVDMVGDTLTIVEGGTPKIVVRGSVPYGQPTSASIELAGDADGNQTQSYRWISTAPDWNGQELRLERKVNNSFQLVGRVPKNTNNLEWQGTIVQGLSDSRVKTNVVSMTEGLDKIDQIRPVTFDWVPTENVSDREGADFGFIAQELEEVLPEVVHTRGDGYKTVMYEKVVPVLVQAMKEQQAMIEALRAEIELLKNK